MNAYTNNNSISSFEQLLLYRPELAKNREAFEQIINEHPMRLTPYYAGLIDWDDENDPIRRMSVPSLGELDPDGMYDTSGESTNTKMSGLQHKYRQTALLLVTNACAMYCRHCFRKRLVGLPSSEIMNQANEAVEYIKQHKEINNVLVSGGDPLTLNTNLLGKILKELAAIAHLDFIRIGTRIPVVDPHRLTDDLALLDLLEDLTTTKKRIYIVTQFNHPRELTDIAKSAIQSILDRGIVMLNQAVLLKGVNDSPEVLAELMSELTQIGVTPYYVFQCRPVARVKNVFQRSLYDAYQIVEEAKKLMNGPTKRFRFAMSHETGKIEIISMTESEMYFKYHQAKDMENFGRFFSQPMDKKAGWLYNI